MTRTVIFFILIAGLLAKKYLIEVADKGGDRGVDVGEDEGGVEGGDTEAKEGGVGVKAREGSEGGLDYWLRNGDTNKSKGDIRLAILKKVFKI